MCVEALTAANTLDVRKNEREAVMAVGMRAAWRRLERGYKSSNTNLLQRDDVAAVQCCAPPAGDDASGEESGASSSNVAISIENFVIAELVRL